MAFPVWINGSEQGRIDPADRGLSYGDGLFETIRVEGGRAVLLDEHIGRLLSGAAQLGMELDEAELREGYGRFVRNCPSGCVTKILVTRGPGGRGYLPDPAVPPTLVFSSHPLPAYPASHQSDGIQAGICRMWIAEQPRLAGIKHLNRLEQVLLRSELAALGADEALVCDSRGNVVEGVFSNVFMVRGGRLQTPALDAAGVRGVLRTAILRRAEEDGRPALEGRFSLDDFHAADEVFFCNSVNGVWPVRSLGERHWVPGTVTRYWQAFWQELL